MDAIADRISKLTPSMTLSITAKAKQLQSEGVAVCSFGAGEPDFDTPDFIKAAAVKALEEGKTKYTPSSGIPELRKAIAVKFLENEIEYDWNQIIVSCGAKHSLFNALMAICDPGDEVIIPAPYWTSYPEMVRMVGAQPQIVETRPENGWKLRPEDFADNMTGRTKALILNSPSNPTGAVYSREELQAIGEVAAAEDILIISDEIYEKLIYNDRKHVSIASLSDELKALTITINGFSKSYAMTGWRLGYLAAPEPIARAIDNIQSHSTSNPTSFAQYGGLAALQAPQEFVEDMRQEFDIRRQYMLNRLRKIKNISVVEPEGAFYFLVDTSLMQLSSLNLTEKLLSRYHVAAVPGIAFGHPLPTPEQKDAPKTKEGAKEKDKSSIRLSYAMGLDVIKAGLDRFEDFCHSH